MRIMTIIAYAFAFMIISSGGAIGQTLYGVAHDGPEGPTTLYMVDPGNGNAAAIGPVGFWRCGGLAYDHSSSILYATCNRPDGSFTPVLVSINPNTGAGTEIGVLDVCREWSDLTVRNSDSALYATGFSNECGGGQNTLVSVDKVTGFGTIVGPMGNLGCCGNAMAFNTNDVLYYMDGDRGPPDTLYIVNQGTGAANVIANVAYPPILDNEPRPNAMAFNDRGELFASVVNGGGQDGNRENYLTQVNIQTGDVTVLGTTVDGLDGIVFVRGTSPVPTMSEWGMVATVAGLGLIGLFYAIRKTRVKA